TITWWFMIVVIVVLTLVLVGYASVKIFWEISLRHKNSEHDKSARRRMERNITTGIVIGVVGINVIALIISLVNTIKEISGSKNFNFGSTKSAGYTFILFFLLLIFLSQGASLLITNKLQTKLKGFFKRLVFTEAFFLHNNFKRKDKKLSTMTFSLLLVSSMIVFSLIAASSVANNQALEAEFKNGADIRVVTYPLDQSFKTNMSQIEGINEVVPVFKTKASIAYDDYTIYGLDPIVYSRVGKWDENSFPDGYSFNNLQILDETYTGIIISEDLAIRLNLSVGDALPVSNLPGGLFHRSFVVAGVITSAPGLGLAHGPNIEMLQPNEGYVIVNDEFFTNELEITSCQLFLASVLPDENIDEIATEVEALLPNIQVNPESINEQFIGSFIEKFVPNIRTFFYMQLIAIILIIIILLIMFTDFTLSQRSQEFAIKLAMGGSRRKITKLLFTEVSIIVLSASLGGIILGILFTYSTFYLITPLLTSHNMIPFSVSIPIIELIVFPIA
ncbi:MAG: ABC transporter permease, partial [Candidatus Heimdallarchaeota archaeon]